MKSCFTPKTRKCATPLYPIQSWKCDPIQRHSPRSLLWGSTPPPPPPGLWTAAPSPQTKSGRGTILSLRGRGSCTQTKVKSQPKVLSDFPHFLCEKQILWKQQEAEPDGSPYRYISISSAWKASGRTKIKNRFSFHLGANVHSYKWQNNDNHNHNHNKKIHAARTFPTTSITFPMVGP